jgi:uncharacterized protein YoxC
MNFPSDTPRLPKWIFLVGYAALLATAWLIFDSSAHPLAGAALWAVVALVVVACVIGVIPFVTDYADKQEEALDNRQRALQALSVTVAAAAEQVSIATTGLNGIAEAAQENFSKSERLAHGIQEKIAELDARLALAAKRDSEAVVKLESVSKAVSELDARLASAKKDDGETAARLEAAAKKLGKAASDFEAAVAKAAEAARAIPAVPVHIPEPPPVIASKIVEIKPAVASSDHPFESPVVPPPAAADPEPAPVPVAAPEPAPAPPAEAAPEAVVTPAEPVAAPELPAEAAPAPKPAPRKRSPRKAAPAPVAPAEPAAPDLVLESPEEPAPAAPEIAEPAVSADGATRLVVTAYIGIGNRLFIRGEGPGLGWDKGVPLSFVSIGKWRWETNDATKAVTFRLYKNDETECTALGERSVAPGAQLELNASF